MASDLMNLVMEVRTASGRPLDAAGQQRMEAKIAGLTPAEVTAERVMLKKLRDYFNKTAVTPNRDRP